MGDVPETAGSQSNVKTLQQKILEGNFLEPKTLFGGMLKQSINGPKKILKVPYEYSTKEKDNQKFYNLNLETV